MSLLRRTGPLVAVALVASLLVALPVGPAQADYDLGVTWPDVSQINPNVSDYEITVIDSGPGELEARWRDGRQAIPHVGTAAVDLTNGEGRVEIWRCVAGSCEWAGVSSPELSVHGSLSLYGWSQQAVSGSPGSWETYVSLSIFAGLTDVQYAWSLRNLADEEVAVGTVTPDQDGTAVTPVPPGLAGGTYTLQFTASGDFVGTTLDSNTFPVTVQVDTTGPKVSGIKLSDTWLFPYEKASDGIFLKARLDEPAHLVWDVVTDGGDLVVTVKDSGVSMPTSVSGFWDGWVDASPVGAGLYRFRFTAVDAYGNESVTVSEPFRVDLGKPTLVTKSVVVPAARIVYDKYVGKCSALITPSSHHWRDSLGYYSQVRCGSDKNNAGVVLVWHATWLPLNADPLAYKRIQVEEYGGPAKGGGRRSFMVMGYIDTRGRFSERVQFNRGLGWHPGHTVTSDFKKWFRYQDGRPYIVWSNGLSAGSRYDIKSFRLTAKAWVYVEPDGTILDPPPSVAESRPPHSSDVSTLAPTGPGVTLCAVSC